MNWPFWCVLGWVGFGVMTVAFWFLNRLLTRSHARELEWMKELDRALQMARKQNEAFSNGRN